MAGPRPYGTTARGARVASSPIRLERGSTLFHLHFLDQLKLVADHLEDIELQAQLLGIVCLYLVEWINNRIDLMIYMSLLLKKENENL